MNKERQLADTLQNEQQYIDELVAMPDDVLLKKLLVVREQIRLAWQQKMTDALELLTLWERQIITARFIKNDFEDTKSKQVKPPKEKKIETGKIEIAAEETRIEVTETTTPEEPQKKQLALF